MANSLSHSIQQLQHSISNESVLNTHVSAANVAWHIDHSLRVITSICTTLSNSNPSQYKWSFNLVRTLVYITGSIPRGKGKAPKAVISTDVITPDSLQQQISLAKEAIILLESLPANSFFKHPYFGLLNLKSSIVFLKIHTKHHQKIINAIIKP
jgi:hypothetical protein